MVVIARVVGCDKSMEVFQRVNDVNFMVHLEVMVSKKVRKKVVTMLLNLVKVAETKR